MSTQEIAAIVLSLAFATPALANDDTFAAGATLVLPSPDMAKLRMEDDKSSGAYRYGVGIPTAEFDISDESVRNWSVTDTLNRAIS